MESVWQNGKFFYVEFRITSSTSQMVIMKTQELLPQQQTSLIARFPTLTPLNAQHGSPQYVTCKTFCGF
jgi:hypothetical protein